MEQQNRWRETELIDSLAEHWELIPDITVYIYSYHGSKRTTLTIPLDISQHLFLNHKDKIDLAIRRSNP